MFQRDSSWTGQERDDLWREITAILKPGGEQGRDIGHLVFPTSGAFDP